MNSEAIIDTRQMQIKFPEEDSLLYVCDSSQVNNIGVCLSEDIIVPGKHEVVHRAAIANPSTESLACSASPRVIYVIVKLCV